MRSTGALLDRDANLAEVLDDCLDRAIDDEAEISGSRQRGSGMRLELHPGLVKIDLLVAEAQCEPPAAKLFTLHADALVEGNGCLGVGAGQDDVVERADPHTQIMSCLRSYGQRPVAGGTRRPYLAPSRLSSSISSFFVAVALSE